MALTGRAALAALGGAALVLGVGSAWAVWAVNAVLLAAIGIDLIRAGKVADLHIERTLAPSVRLGETTGETLRVVNTGQRRVRGVLRDAWQPSAGAHDLRLPLDVRAGTATTITTALTPTRRGDRRADRVVVRSLGPLGLAARQGTHHVPGTLRVLPEFASRRHLPARLERLRSPGSRASALIRGQGTEFDSLREYVIGDDVRSIDWRASARATDVTVRTWRPERDRQVLLVLDTGRTAAGRVGDAPRLDAAMDAALLLAALAAAAGDRVDLLAYDRRVRAAVTGVNGAALLPALISAMAPIEADLVETDMRSLAAEIRRRGGRGALVVLLSSLDPAPVTAGLLPVLPALIGRHRVLLASVADTRVAELAGGRGDIDAVYGAAAAERTRGGRAQAAALLARHGVEVLDEPPATLAPALADRYLSLKAAGRL
ncbi:MAG: DUF58 domain-containing protein [Sporichthyaceae bacterium]